MTKICKMSWLDLYPNSVIEFEMEKNIIKKTIETETPEKLMTYQANLILENYYKGMEG
jgi:hypothetical protein